MTFQWETPTKILDQSRKVDTVDTIWLPPPQFYELSRLSHEPDIEQIIPFAKERGINSTTTLIFPIQYYAFDGVINCYPGDDLYPKNPNYVITEHNVEEYASKTCEECRQLAQNLHRSEIKSLNDVQILQNIKSPDNHLSPQKSHSSKL